MSEALTRHNYRLNRTQRWESLSTLSVQRNAWKGFLQYEIKPKSFFQKDDLHTGYVRLGHQIGKRKIFNLFYSVSSLKSNLKDPEVWRAGVEYVNDLF